MFKVGDKVRRISSDWGKVKYGEVYTIVEIISDFSIKLDVDPETYYKVQAFELYWPAPSQKAVIKPEAHLAPFWWENRPINSQAAIEHMRVLCGGK